MVSNDIGLKVPVGLATMNALKQLGCPADLCLLFVLLGTAIFSVNVQPADHVFLIVSDKPNLVPRVVLVQSTLDTWFHICHRYSLVQRRLPEDEGQEEELPFDHAFEVKLVS